MLEVRQIFKDFEGQPLLKGVSLTVSQGETVCLLGPSGSGKSTLLRIIAGLEPAESGQVLWDGRDLKEVPVYQRRFGLMFQDYALFPHKNVADNVAFGLRMQNLPADEIKQRVQEALEQVHLQAFARRRVTDLSGGEQQRVALARALAPRPLLIMLDEPLGAMDRALREQLIGEIRGLLHETRIPAIYVTHDQEEAFTIADRLVLLHDGMVEQSGVPEVVYSHPASTWVAQFFGLSNLIEGTVSSTRPLQVDTPLGRLAASCTSTALPLKGAVTTLLLMPSGASLTPTEGDGGQLQGTVEDAIFRGEGYRIRLRCGDSYHFDFNVERPAAVGESLTLYLTPDAVQCLG
jgi:ABC-type Fe3+/spermidine/putrescine transport system ATPase subunit